MLKEIDECVAKGESFAFETTLSGLTYLRRIREWKKLGYFIHLYFLTLPNPEMAISRVAERVQQGGHNIPEHVIRRRFTAGLQNFEQHYRQAVDKWTMYDNSNDLPILLAFGTTL